MQGLILNHPFVDGNKRTGTGAMARFLYINRYNLRMTKKELVEIAIWVELKKILPEGLATWIKKHSKKI